MEHFASTMKKVKIDNLIKSTVDGSQTLLNIGTATPSPPPPPLKRTTHHQPSLADLYDNCSTIRNPTELRHLHNCQHYRDKQQLTQHPIQRTNKPTYRHCCNHLNVPAETKQTTICPYHHRQSPASTTTPNIMPTISARTANNINNHSIAYPHSYYYDNCLYPFEEQDSVHPEFRDQEFHVLHRNIPALRRAGYDTTSIRQHFYPDGGWGWIICGMSFLVHILTTGIQLSFGITLFYAIQHAHNVTGKEWLGVLSWSVSLLITPFVETICRRKSTRLLAVVGGLIMSLGILFTSFATEMEQIIFSYGFVFAIGVGLVRETSTIMLGNYFKKRRLFAEMVVMSGEGIGIALFSVLLREAVGKMGWRAGLQIIAGLCSISIFVGLLYRPASLYHPQRRAIQHLKNQRRKFQMQKPTKIKAKRRNVCMKILQDISNLKSATIKILLITSTIAALGVYTPIFTLALSVLTEPASIQELVLLQTILGVSITLGVVSAGVLIRRHIVIRNFHLSASFIAQVFIALIALSILFMSFVAEYHSLCILSGTYGFGFGGYRLALKLLTLELLKLQCSKIWCLIRGFEAIPVAISVPLTVFLNDYSLKYGRAGYYICSAAAAIAAITIFFINQRLQLNNTTAISPPLFSLPSPSVRSKLRKGITPEDCTNVCGNGCEHQITRDFLPNSCINLKPVQGVCPHHHLPPLQHRSATCLAETVEDDLDYHYPYPYPHPYPLPHPYIGSSKQSLRRSISYMPSSSYCDLQRLQYQCPQHIEWSRPCIKNAAINSTLQTFDYNPEIYFQHCKSQSVPEGLSTLRELCKCNPHRYGSAFHLSRDVSLQPTCHHCHYNQSRCNSRTHLTAQYPLQSIYLRPHNHMCKHQRSQSLTKPMQFVEQITTSV